MEFQPYRSASSTHQELQGQLGVEHWFEKFQEWWGVPHKCIEARLVIDSQASIDIVQAIPPHGIGLATTYVKIRNGCWFRASQDALQPAVD